MFKYLTNVISRALGFTKTESRGTLVLILIISIFIFLTQIRINYLKNQPPTVVDSSAVEWIKKVEASYELKKQPEQAPFENPKPLVESNTIDAKPVTTRKEEDEKKIISKPRDINTATATELQEVRGIGPAFSERIIKYRDLLGGFSDSTQLNEVYGLRPEVIAKLFKSFKIKSSVNLIDLNTDSIQHLAKHPYISYDLAKVIINYRREHGDFKDAADLLKIKALDDTTFIRIKPYLE